MELILSDEQQLIKRSGQIIYVHCELTAAVVFQFAEALAEASSIRSSSIAYSPFTEVDLPPITISVHSLGGDLSVGFAIADMVHLCKHPTVSIIEGYAASAATLISLAANKRYMRRNSWILLHQLTAGVFGKHAEIVDHSVMLAGADAQLADFYVERTKMKRKQVREILKRESWFDAKRAIELGLVDEILARK